VKLRHVLLLGFYLASPYRAKPVPIHR